MFVVIEDGEGVPGIGVANPAPSIIGRGSGFSSGFNSGCTPAAKTGGSGTISVTLKIKAGSCQGLVKGGQTIPIPSATEKWHNGKTSTYHLTAKTGTGSNATVATITGTVSKGLFAGKHAKAQLKITTPSSENCTPGHPVRHISLKNTPNHPWLVY